MEKLRIRSKKTRPDGAGACKKHQKQEPSPGVCSFCLQEKLTKLSKSSGSSRRTYTTTGLTSGSPSTTTSSLSSYYSSSDNSSCPSPPHPRASKGIDTRGEYRYGDNGNKEKSRSIARWLLGEGGDEEEGGGGYVLKKSRSLVNYLPRRQRSTKESAEEKKGRRFWSRLLRPISKRKEETATLVHSRTVREVSVPNRLL